MKGVRVKAVTVVDMGGAGHFGICWASGILGAENIRVVRDTNLVLISRTKQPGALEELEKAVKASIKANRSDAVIIALHQKKSSVSKKKEQKKLFYAMQIVKSWGLPIEDDKMIGIRFEGEGDAMQVGTWKNVQVMSTL